MLQERPIEAGEKKFADFIAEIARIQEEEKNGIRKTNHFSAAIGHEDIIGHEEVFNPSAMTREDMAIWEKIKDGSITEKDLQDYKKTIPLEDTNRSRGEFYRFISNQEMAICGERRYVERHKNGNNQIHLHQTS